MNKNKISNSEDILVSVCVITYGHERYISQALDSILMQEVNFNYEIIVGEDCSPDGTREILKNYEKKYPHIFNMVYRDGNLGGRLNALDLNWRCRGKYIAVLEGDDFWTDKKKLQKQVDLLEMHPEYIATSHKVHVVDENNNIKNESYPSIKESVYTKKHYMKGYLPGQSGTIMRRNYFRDYNFDYSILEKPELSPGDRVNAMVLVSLGQVYCFPEVMSSYRHVTRGGTSYSANKKKKSNEEKLYFWENLLEFSRTQTKDKEVTVFLESKRMEIAIRSIGRMPLKTIKNIWKDTTHKIRVLFYVVNLIVFGPIKIITKRVGNLINGQF